MASREKAPRKPGFLGGVNWKAPFLGLSIMLGGNWAATQYLAARFGYDQQLGTPFQQLGTTPIYEPFHWVLWIIRYAAIEDPAIRHVVYTGAGIAVGSMFTAMMLSIFINLYHNKNLLDNTEDLHGSARWATTKDLQETGLLTTTQGVYVGAWKDERSQLRYLKHDGPEHIVAFAPTRSGKGVSLVIPTLLSWQGSCIVNDIKGENWDITSGFRERAGQTCLRFAPVEMDRERRGVRFNPLAEIRVNTERDVSDAQNLAEMLCQKPHSKADDDDYFRDGAVSLLTGLILHVCYVAFEKGRRSGRLEGSTATFTDLRSALSPIFRDADQNDMGGTGSTGQSDKMNAQQALFREHLTIIRDMNHDYKDEDGEWHNQWQSTDGAFTGNHPAIAEAMQNMLVRADREFASVHGSAIKPLRLYADPLVSYSVGGSDFRISALVNAEKPVSLYLVVPVSDQDRLAPLVRLMYTMFVNRLTESFDDSRSYKHRLLLMIDEFPTLGKMPIFASALAYMGGYGLKAYLIAQDVEQITEYYGEHESVTSNCHIRLAFSPNKMKTAELVSDMLGTQTIQRASLSFSGERTKNVLSTVSKTVEHVERPLMTPDEVTRLRAAIKQGEGKSQKIIEAGEMLIIVSGSYPIRGTQLLFFKDEELLRRSKMKPARVRGNLPPVPVVLRTTTTVTNAPNLPASSVPEPTPRAIEHPVARVVPVEPTALERASRSKVQDAYDFSESHDTILTAKDIPDIDEPIEGFDEMEAEDALTEHDQEEHSDDLETKALEPVLVGEDEYDI
jgi:type IV secretion system protein VirD4